MPGRSRPASVSGGDLPLKIYHSPTSPSVRQVMVAAHEKGVGDQLELRPTLPWNADAEFERADPIGKVPTLLRDDGPAMTDSRVIVEYIDSLGTTPALFPAAGEARWRNFRHLSLGDGIIDASIA